MEWLGDYLRFCLDNGLGGLTLLALSGGVALIVVLTVLAGIAEAARAVARGWRKAGQTGS